MVSLDSFKCCRSLKVGSKTYAYYSLPAAEEAGLKGVSRLPRTLKVLLENLLRHEDGRSVAKEDLQGVAQWLKTKTSEREIAFHPARVLMQARSTARSRMTAFSPRFSGRDQEKFL